MVVEEVEIVVVMLTVGLTTLPVLVLMGLVCIIVVVGRTAHSDHFEDGT